MRITYCVVEMPFTHRTLRDAVRACSLLFAVLCLAGCKEKPVDGLRVDLDKGNEERLLRYYLGGYAAPEGADPVASGLLVHDGAFAIRPENLDVAHRVALRDTDGNGTIGWEEFASFVEATYAEARSLPPTLEEMLATHAAFDTSTQEVDTALFRVDIDGVMTSARRRLSVPTRALQQALTCYLETGAVCYPVGTLIVGEHWQNDAVVETTVKRRRADGFWDFAVYDANGRLASGTTTAPRPLRAPVQCVGCHLGKRRFEPEKSFPRDAPDGPFGPRAIYVDEATHATVDQHDLVSRFDEHARRDDGVLGLYVTLYTARLLKNREEGRVSAEEADLLAQLEL